MTSEEDSKGFQVRDRRRFTAEGDIRDENAENEPAAADASAAAGARIDAAAQEQAQAGSPASSRASSQTGTGPGAPGDEPAPEITLGAFLMSLSTQALFCLGEIPDPVEGKVKEDLQAARELIDILAMLQQKTRGNLDADEARLLEDILFDLRMRYVKKARQ